MRTLNYLAFWCGHLLVVPSLAQDETISTSSVSLGGVQPPQKEGTKTYEGERSFPPTSAAPTKSKSKDSDENSLEPTQVGKSYSGNTAGAGGECVRMEKKSSDLAGEVHWAQINREETMDMCEQFCEPYKNPDEISSVTCFGKDIEWSDGQGNGKSDDLPDGTEVRGLGQCLCNNPLINTVVETVIEKGLPAIGEIACKTWFTAIDSVVQIGLAFIPGAGPIVSTLLNFAAQAAQVIAYAITEAKEQEERYKKWLEDPDNADASEAATNSLMDNVCGNKYTPDEGNKAFKVFQDIADAASVPRLFAGAAKSWPPPFPKGKGKPEEIDDFINGLNPRDSKGKSGKGNSGDSDDDTSSSDDEKSSDKDKGKTEDKSSDKDTSSTEKSTDTGGPSQTTKSDASQQSAHCKRDGKGKGKDCDHITLYSIEKLSQGNINRPTITCATAATQACAHYYSAIQQGRSSEFTCKSSMKVDNRGGPKAVRDWHRHHTDKTWRQFTTSWYSYGGGRPDGPPTCEADEWPPNYFLDSDQLKQGTKNKDGQLVRWLPQNPNGDAGLQWRLWCQENDGDAGNGLREKPAGAEELKSGNEVDLKTKPFNRQLVDLKGDPTVKSSTSMGVTTTTSIWSSAEFSRGVFSFTFDFATTPSADNNWLLEENPCWPKYIAPKDPGYPLARDDPWYDVQKPKNQAAKKFKEDNDYSKPPSNDLIEAAENRQKEAEEEDERAEKHDLSDSGDDDKKPPPKDRKKTGDDGGGSGSSSRRRSPNEVLEIVDGRLMARDEVLNSTRQLSHEELSQVEVRRCTTRFCKEERREMGNEELDRDTVLVPGQAPPSMPSENGAVPTMSTSYVKRDSAEGELVFEPATGETSGAAVAATDGRI